MLLSLAALTLLLFLLFATPSDSAPLNTQVSSPFLVKKQYQPGDVPWWDESIPSCVVCEPAWPSISSCAAAAPAFQSWSNMIYNPGAFVDEIKCACTDTFVAAYPQCVDCFVQTNQCPQFLGVPSESGGSSIMDGIRQVCGFGSALLGGVASAQATENLTYTYNGVPSQGYPTTTSYGPGGIDLGSAEGAAVSTTSAGGRTGLELRSVVAAGLGALVLMMIA